MLSFGNRMKENNIIMGHDTVFKNVIIIVPPMCFTCENAHRVIITMDKVLKAIEEEDDYNLDSSDSGSPAQQQESSHIMNFMYHQPGPSTSRGSR